MQGGSEPDEDQLKEALNEITESANNGGWTITALTYLPHDRMVGQFGPLTSGVTIVATLSKP